MGDRLRIDILRMARTAFPTLRWSIPPGSDGRAYTHGFAYERRHDCTPSGIRRAVRLCLGAAEAKRDLEQVQRVRELLVKS